MTTSMFIRCSLVCILFAGPSVQAFSTHHLQKNRMTPSSFRLYAEDEAAAAAPTAPKAEEKELPSTYVRCGKCQTSYPFTAEDLGGRNARRLECSLCGHSWFQSKDRIMSLGDSFEIVPLPQRDIERIQLNIDEGKPPSYYGEKKLYVGNISFDCTEDDIFELFGTTGQVGDVSLVRDDDGRVRGFGFITMRTEEGADKAIAELDGKELKGRDLAVRPSNS